MTSSTDSASDSPKIARDPTVSLPTVAMADTPTDAPPLNLDGTDTDTAATEEVLAHIDFEQPAVGTTTLVGRVMTAVDFDQPAPESAPLELADDSAQAVEQAIDFKKGFDADSTMVGRVLKAIDAAERTGFQRVAFDSTGRQRVAFDGSGRYRALPDSTGRYRAMVLEQTDSQAGVTDTGTDAVSGLKSRIHRLKNHQTLLLDQPNVFWMVAQGSLDLLSTKVRYGAPVGMRRHLFRLPTRGAVVGCAANEAGQFMSFMAVAVGETTVIELRFEPHVEQVRRLAEPDRLALEGWMSALGRHLVVDLEKPPAMTCVDCQTEPFFLGKGDVIGLNPENFAWLEVQRGELQLFGQPELSWQPTLGGVLISAELWWRATQDTEVVLRPFDDALTLWNTIIGLGGLHRLFNRRLNQLHEVERRAEVERRMASRYQQRSALTDAYETLSDVLDPQERFKRRDTELLTAVQALGQQLGVEIRPPLASEDLSRVEDPIEAIARASKLRHRKIILNPDWWQHDGGPLLAYLGEERRPIALLPTSEGYHVVDPATRERQPLTATMREAVQLEATMLYRPLPSTARRFTDLLRFTTRGRVGDLTYVLLCGIAIALLGMVAPRVTGALVDNAIPNADGRLLWEFAALLTATALGTALFTYAQAMASVRTGTLADITAQSAMWDRLLKFKPDFFRRYASGELQTRVNAVGEVVQEMSSSTVRPLISGVLALLNFLLLWYYSWDLAKIALWIGAATLVMTAIAAVVVRRHALRLHDLEGEFNGLMIQMIAAVGKLRVAGAEYRAFNHWVVKYTEQLVTTLRIQRAKDTVDAINRVVPPIASALIFWHATDLTIGLSATDPKAISIGDFIAFNTAFILYLTGWADVSNTLLDVQSTLVKTRRIKPLLEGQVEVADDASDPGRLSGSIRFENVSFRYHEDGPIILREVSFEIAPGEFVAFVGPSGSGKSTILRLMLGFERPTEGRILFDGQDLAGLDILAVRRQMGSVLQNGRLSAGNIMENIANNTKLSHAEIWDAIADAGLSDDVERLPMGLHSMVAEGGSNFSGGQRQRLLIARALAARPRIVLFDEATSALDNKTQAIVSEALDRRRVTRLSIAHRLSTIRKADRIYVLQSGQVVQAGNFDTLSKQPGLFQDLMSRQMA